MAVADFAGTSMNVAVTVDVLANDGDADGDLNPNSLRISKPATEGVAGVIDGGGGPVIRYTPAPDATGDDSFRYEICDVTFLCAQATVVITIADADRPLAFAGSHRVR